MNSGDLTKLIKAEALNLGFSACGIAPAEPVDSKERENFNQWLGNGFQADMSYLERNQDKRYDPSLLVEGAKSIISVALNYYPQKILNKEQLQFAYYAYGKDYHDLVKNKLTRLLEYIQTVDPQSSGRVFCDTAPILEKYWAWKSGLGWVGKNTLLILPKAGSFFFLGEIILNSELEYDSPKKSHCGSCKRCLEACPTHALTSDGNLNANLCLSYQTIENHKELSASVKQAMKRTIYGCDECQKACPWNSRFATANNEPDLQPNEEFFNNAEEDWQNLSVESYRRIFKGSAAKRAKYEGLIRNISAVTDADKADTH